MPAPVPSFIQLPSTAENIGPKIRTQLRDVIVNGQSVSLHEYVFEQVSDRSILGVYGFTMGVDSVQTSAQNGTSTAFFWLQNPANSARNLRLRRLEIAITCITETDLLTAPRLAIAAFSFTGAASGAQLTPQKLRPSDAAALATVRTAVTGMTVTVGGLVWGTVAPALLFTTSGQVFAAGEPAVFAPTNERDFPEVAPGNGLLFYQPDAGSASDGRKIVTSGIWDEVEP